MQAIDLFPTPFFRIDEAISDMDCYEIAHILSTIKYHENDGDLTLGSQRSQNTWILGKYFPILQQTIENTFTDIARNELGLQTTCEFRIMSSWGVRTKPGGKSIRHTHSNSFWSGVLYVSPNPSAIAFTKETDTGIMVAPVKHTKYSVTRVEHKPEMGQVIFFPSTMMHQVCKNDTEETRYSVAFNILPDGIFGKHDSTANICVMEH